VLAKLPKAQQQLKAKRALQEIWMAESKRAAETAFDGFIQGYDLKYAKAAQCLAKDRDALVVFYDFPAEHWKHLREPRTRLKARSRPCATAPFAPKAAFPTRPRSPWSSSWSKPRNAPGAASTVATNCQK